MTLSQHTALATLRNEPFILMMAGQSTPWGPVLDELTQDPQVKAACEELLSTAQDHLSAVAPSLAALGVQPLSLLRSQQDVDAADSLNPYVSMPGVLMTQFATLASLKREGLDFSALSPRSIIGHSQGILGVELFKAWREGADEDVAKLFALAQLIGGATAQACQRLGLSSKGEYTPMLSVRGIDEATLLSAMSTLEGGTADISIALRNDTRSFVLSGYPEDLAQLVLHFEARNNRETAERAARKRGGLVFAPLMDFLPTSAPFHSSLLTPAVEQVQAWAALCGLDPDMATRMASRILVEPVDWVTQVRDALKDGGQWLCDLGPGSTLAKITRRLVEGRGVGVIELGSQASHDLALTPGHGFSKGQDWSRFLPSLLQLPDGQTVVDTAFSRLTGHSPVLLAGMTPTTVDPDIVAAAANGGYWAELAGGGQVTEPVFAHNLAGLKTLLKPGRTAQFNSMFMDRYLWNLQFGAQQIVTRARQAGAPLDGVVISAGIPEVEEAPELIEGLRSSGFPYVALKPGTVAQIRQCLAIAAKLGDTPVILQVEDGHAGGHHSWEDLDELLIATYADIRQATNVVLCVGGGIGTPERAAEFLSGSWSGRYDLPLMPVDGVMLGTVAMVCDEAKTNDDVKQLLVDTAGVSMPDAFGGWVASGANRGGMTSGLSHLRADMYEIDNAAAACSRLIVEVEGNLEATLARRDELIEALNKTAKPYFGDLETMTYAAWATRFAELSYPWADESWQQRYFELLQRIEARLCDQEYGEIVSLFGSVEDVAEAPTALERLLTHYPQARDIELTPIDCSWFIDLCRKYPKPCPFVPAIDADLLRWWGQDSLWQSHDPRYTADQVRIIPSPVSVAGITRINEPVAELLGRFETAAVKKLISEGEEPKTVFSRLGAVFSDASSTCTSAEEYLRAIPHISWTGHVIANPAYTLDPQAYKVVKPEGQEHAPGEFDLVITLDTFWDDLPEGDRHHAVRTLIVPLTLSPDVATGALPCVNEDRLPQHMRALLAGTAGVRSVRITGDPVDSLPRMLPSDKSVFGEAKDYFTLGDNLGVDHKAVTGQILDATHVTAQMVPDALLGPCWPAIYAALGSANHEDYPVIEGLLNAVHLDHRENLHVPLERLHELAKQAPEGKIEITAWMDDLRESSSGRIVTVRENLSINGQILVEMAERFAIRGRISSNVAPPEPPFAGGADVEILDTPRSMLRRTKVKAPADMTAFANVSGDYNPIHTSTNAAIVAGMEAPLVHGMWLSAVAQHVASSSVKGSHAQEIAGWTYAMFGMVQLGDEIEVLVERVGKVKGGGLALNVTCRIDGDVVSQGTAVTRAVKTAYVYPGQGIQAKGMALDERSKSPAARLVWERADAHTRKALGFSIIALVRDNPTQLTARGVTYRHPQGVLNLTQFTQVALTTVALAQTARLREAGSVVSDSYYAGHSLGEYTALSAYAQVLPLETVIELVFHRGSTMHHLVERDAEGRSNYAMGALRPNQMGLGEEDVQGFIEDIATASGEFLQIANYNLAGQQYAVAGTIAGLEVLALKAEERARDAGGKRPFMLVPGIDVPFHSEPLRNGVPEFREKLDLLLPHDLDYKVLEGRYIPNLVARPFELSREFIGSMLEVVPSEVLRELYEDSGLLADLAATPVRFARLLLVELLCWQFASPVRWIETQRYLLSSTAKGGAGVEQLIEVGLGASPTLANMASKTLSSAEYARTQVSVLNVGRDEAKVYAEDVTTIDLVDEAGAEDSGAQDSTAVDSTGATHSQVDPTQVTATETSASPSASTESTASPANPVPVAPQAAPAPVASGAAMADVPFKGSDAVKVLIAYSTKMNLEQIGAQDTTETLTNGVSSKRNQLLMDMSAELSLATIDGAAEADIATLSNTVDTLAHNYKAFGPILSEAIRDRLRKLLGASGVKASHIANRLEGVWQLGAGWNHWVTAEILLGTREGQSTRGGDLAGLGTDAPSSAAAVDALIDAAVGAVGARLGVPVSMPSAGGGSGSGVVDSAALEAYADTVTGPNGVLAQAALTTLKACGLGGELPAGTLSGGIGEETAQQAEVLATLSAELGSNWPALVTPAFTPEKAVLLDDRWASAREDVARLYVTGDLSSPQAKACFVGAGQAVSQQAAWWASEARKEGRHECADLLERIVQEADAEPDDNHPTRRYAGQVAVVTGMSERSIAGSVVAGLLAGGATVVATASRVDAGRLSFAKRLYRENAAHGASLWLVPANLSSYRDVDAVVEWVGAQLLETVGGTTKETKPALLPTLFFPFAAPPVSGSLADAGPSAENQARLLLWSVERMMAGLANIGIDTAVDNRLHVVLPGSPNRGTFGGDGAYGEVKAAFDAIVNKWSAEKVWSSRVTLVHALIGWVRGTGLMGGNDPLVQAVEDTGIRTWSTEEIAGELLAACAMDVRRKAEIEPVTVDLTGGLGSSTIDLRALKASAMSATSLGISEGGHVVDVETGFDAVAKIPALPSPTLVGLPAVDLAEWQSTSANLHDTVVIVGVGEVSPWGTGRTRLQAELGIQDDGQVDLTAAGVLELAWMMGLLTWKDTPKAGWYDADGNVVEESDIYTRYRDEVIARCGVRTLVDDGPLKDLGSVEAASVFLDRDIQFTVPDQETAQSYIDEEPSHTTAALDPETGEWLVTRMVGAEIRVPRKATLSRTVGGQFPTGFDPQRWGLSASMMESMDQITAWNLVATVDAYLSSGFTPAEILQAVHPTEIASTQGTGFGGMSSMRKLFVDRFLGEDRPQDILQETLPNVVAAHVMQSYVGGYGAMIHPVGACATAAVSLEEGVDKIATGKASFVVTGAIDDISVESLTGFGDMNATALSQALADKGINERFYSRANDRRRAGFVEGQGGGTVLITRGDIAADLGLPVLGVVAYAASFADGTHSSIPAPGLGALGAAMGGKDSRLAKSLATYGLNADDIAVVSKHDTSTNANDPNESELHTRMSRALGRTPGNPLVVISQKTLTGHAKGGAAIFQTNGLCQLFAGGVIPANKSLDCVDPAMEVSSPLTWLREPLALGTRRTIKAGILTSLGFGHVSSVVTLIHPGAFEAILFAEGGESKLSAWRNRAEGRLRAGLRRLESGMLGHASLYEAPPAGRRFAEESDGYDPHDAEAQMLLDPNARLGSDGIFA
ncbi:MAG: DUF1729 domain-containing protein [Actinomycetaceae bacterium]|nr:DUF1729 domain-containing protein [Actinomycetaceae bacterium]